MRTLTFHQVLGVGAMGTVYRAALRDQQGITRDCAVKVIRTSHPDQEQFRGRMRDEARLLGMLRDEQILGVSELVTVEGHDGVVMEYVEGVDLAELLGCAPEKGQPRITMPPRALAELGADLAGTLHRAHSANNPTTGEPLRVIHRDLKPANVMVTAAGEVRLLDFGVARAAFESRESHTQGLVLGTLNYFPPEILAGAEPTPAVDLYGLGLSVWECASGADWGAPQVHRHRFERRVEQRVGELSPDYEPLTGTIRRLLAWRPQDRPDGAAAERLFAQAVEACGGPSLAAWASSVVPPRLAARAVPP
ncbi:MAG: serine/threonine-protein kinase, partial [Myxococcota bacterium]